MISVTKLKICLIGLCLAALLVALVAGCGSASEDSASASEPLTQAQFIKRATEICEREDPTKERRLTAASKLGPNYLAGEMPEMTELVTKVILPLYEELIEELGDLNPPVEGKAEAERLVAKYEKTLEEAEANPEGMVTNDIFISPNRAALKYGIKNCTL